MDEDEVELFFSNQLSSNPNDPPNTTPEDRILDFVLPMDGSTTNLYGNRGSRRQQRKLLANDNNYDDDKKKSMHRDIERQRRQEMAILCASLRNLLPLEYIKGKRAMSDHMNGAVRYIKELQERIDELSSKRDELKKMSSLSGFDQGRSSNDSFPNSFVVHQSLASIKIVVSTSLGPAALNLSRVLQLLLEQGLDVFSCFSTRIQGGGVIHTIQSEVSDLTGVDVHRLEQKLNDEISSLNQKFY